MCRALIAHPKCCYSFASFDSNLQDGRNSFSHLLHIANVVGFALSPTQGLQGFSPSFKPFQIHVPVEEAPRQGYVVIFARSDSHFPHAPHRFVVGSGHVLHAVVMQGFDDSVGVVAAIFGLEEAPRESARTFPRDAQGSPGGLRGVNGFLFFLVSY